MFINVMYFEADDADIIYIPNSIYDNIEGYAQQFCNWLDSDEPTPEYYVTINGRTVPALETDGFVAWLNKYICLGDDKAYIVEQHTSLREQYLTIYF